MSAATLDSIPAPVPLDVDELDALEPIELGPAEPVVDDAGDVKPKRSRRRSSTPAADRKPRASKPRGAVAAQKSKRVAETVAGLHGLAGELLLPMAGMPATGAALVAQADAAGDVWAKLALRYPAIERLFATSGDGMLFAQLAMVYMPVIMAAMGERAASSADERADAGLAAAMSFVDVVTAPEAPAP